MASITKGKIVKPPIQLQLQKINLTNLSQQKNIQLSYLILQLLSQITNNNPQIVNTTIYTTLINQLFNFQDISSLKQTSLWEKFMYKLWNNETFNFQLRERTQFYKIVSNWIISFELKSGKLDSIFHQFQLIKNFMMEETKTILERLIMIQEIYDDLKELIIEDFWKQEEIIDHKKVFSQKNKRKVSSDFDDQKKKKKKEEDELPQQKAIQLIYMILSVIESLINPIFYLMNPSKKIYKNILFTQFQFKNVNNFIKKSLYYILKFKNIPSYLQTDITKLALIYLQSLDQTQSESIINLIKFMMMKTNKAVRFALVMQYVQFYEHLEVVGYEDVIQQLQNLIYFRQLIIGKKILQDNINQKRFLTNNANLIYNELSIKAGLSTKIYFSNQSQGNILKLNFFIEENDINLKIFYYDGPKILEIKKQENNKAINFNKFIFDVVEKLNNFNAGKCQHQKSYWSEQRCTSKKLQIKLQYKGLYYIEFDNSYSWVLPKNIKYRLEMYQPLQ